MRTGNLFFSSVMPGRTAIAEAPKKSGSRSRKCSGPATGPSRLTLYPVLVLNSNPKYLYAAFTDSKQVREPDLRITLN